jgi:hypothetical protein
MSDGRTYWLVEGAAVYWTGRSADGFDPDITEALRFARYDDAQRVLYYIIPRQLQQLCRVAQHADVTVEETRR